jgi:magnesium chelatase subunit D
MKNMAWDDALWGLAALSADPSGLKGIWLKCSLGPVMQEFLDWLNALKPNSLKVPCNVDTERLIGGLDLALTLQMGRPITQKGMLAQSMGRLLICPMAERLPQATASILTQVLDSKKVTSYFGHDTQPSVFGLVAIDESTPQEDSISNCLSEQLAIWLDLTQVNPGVSASDETLDMLEHVERSLVSDPFAYRKQIDDIVIEDADARGVCELAMGFSVQSMRAPLYTVRLASVLAILRGSQKVEAKDLGRAARLVLTPRAKSMPRMEEDPEDNSDNSSPQPSSPSSPAQPLPPEPPPPTSETKEEQESQNDSSPEDSTHEDLRNESLEFNESNQNKENSEDQKLSDIKELETSILEAALATLPPGLLNQLMRGHSVSKKGSAGRVGEVQRGAKKGRPMPPIQGLPQGGNRLHILATLRHAAPRQKIRNLSNNELNPDATSDKPLNEGAVRRLKIFSEDFHIQRFAKRSESCIIFCIDASGSAALERLAEAKGAVELLLKDSYARRDHICVISFRDKLAQVQLPPTRSLVRAKRQLQALPGGGGTPLAGAMKLALETATQARNHGMTPTVVMLSDGRAHVTLQGEGSRATAKAQALNWASLWRACQLRGIWLDTSARPEPQAQELALAMGASYVPLPLANSQKMANAVQKIQNLKD